MENITVPFSALVLSDLNVRKTNGDLALDARHSSAGDISRIRFSARLISRAAAARLARRRTSTL